MLMAFTGPILLTNMSVWITVGLTEDRWRETRGTISLLSNNNDNVELNQINNLFLKLLKKCLFDVFLIFTCMAYFKVITVKIRKH